MILAKILLTAAAIHLHLIAVRLIQLRHITLVILVLGAEADSTAVDQLDLGKINVTHLIKDYHSQDSLLLRSEIIIF